MSILIDYNITVYPRSKTKAQRYEMSSIPISEFNDTVVVFDRKKLKAFCQNQKCAPNKKYMVNSFGIGYMIDAKITVVDCPHCSHALFWSNDYDKINNDNKNSPPKKRKRRRKRISSKL